MNALELHIAAERLDESKVMDFLQDNGWISDNAVKASDVAKDEAVRAVAGMKAMKIARGE